MIEQIEGTNLSKAWYKTLELAVNSTNKELTPFLISLTGFEEDLKFREILDKSLSENKKASINTVAETIFPQSLYEYFQYDRFELYKRYKINLARIKKVNKKNRNGTYFERLISFDGHENQLEIIISSYLKDKGVRRSKLQASIFDPRYDHTDSPYQGFPCLQHVTFYVNKNGGLILNSFYAIQYLYERGYGNWLGLTYLGQFMAKEMNLRFEKFNCFVGVEQLDYLGKTDARKLLQNLKENVGYD
ncbi:hypothetical protein [Flavobacterium sp.]|jgi:hypothetical protein|uniref:hypothetical protein n=1 Tax=Flavobacterium sp. TaxID=239 RepID=UPI0037C19218